MFVVVGFAFKVSAVPFHTWAPDTYEGAPTPVTAFLSVASKAAGFVALLQLIFVGFFGRNDVWAAAVLGARRAVDDRRQPHRPPSDEHRSGMLAYSSIAQAGFMLVPLAVAGDSPEAARARSRRSSPTSLIYAVMNLGAFAVVIVVARKTRSGEIVSFGGLFQYAPALTRGDDVLPLLARRHAAARGLGRQVRRSSGRCSTPAAAGPSRSPWSASSTR